MTGSLSGTQLRAGVAAIALGFCLLLPWYHASYGRVTNNLTAFGAFSWVEAAILVVVAAVLYLLWARAQQRGFHLPGGDGTAVTIAGGWAVFLLIWRLFDRPDVAQGSLGVQWGLFVTMLAAAALAGAGLRMRAEHRPEPPNPAADDPTWEMPAHTPRRRAADPDAVTRHFGEDRPEWEGEPPEAPGRVKRAEPPPPGKLF